MSYRINMSYREKDLAEVFEEQSNKIAALAEKVSEFEETLKGLPTAEQFEELKTNIEQAKPGKSFVEAVIALIKETGVKGPQIDELLEKLEAMTKETGEYHERKYIAMLPTGDHDTDESKAAELAKKIMGAVD